MAAHQIVEKTTEQIRDLIINQKGDIDGIKEILVSMSNEQIKQTLELCILLSTNKESLEVLKSIDSKLTPPEPIIIEKIVEKEVPVPYPEPEEKSKERIKELENKIIQLENRIIVYENTLYNLKKDMKDAQCKGWNDAISFSNNVYKW